MKFIFLVGIVLSAEGANALKIETASGPTEENRSTIIRRHTLFVADKKAFLAKCQDTEVVCTPDSAGIKLRRELPYSEYLGHLARRFDVDAKYLENAERGLKSYESAIRTLTSILENQNLEVTERSNAQSRFDELTRRGGTKDRFIQAAAIKKSIESADVVTFAKEQEQFEQANYPFNFTNDLNATDPSVIFEPSTEKTYWLASTGATRAEADQICRTRGKQFKPVRQIKDIPNWLYSSALGAALPSNPVGSRQKALWIDGASVARRQGKVQKFPENTFGDVKPYEIIVHYPDVVFTAAAIREEGSSSFSVTVTSNNHEDKRPDDELILAASLNTGKLGALCVSSAPEDDTF